MRKFLIAAIMFCGTVSAIASDLDTAPITPLLTTDLLSCEAVNVSYGNTVTITVSILSAISGIAFSSHACITTPDTRYCQSATTGHTDPVFCQIDISGVKGLARGALHLQDSTHNFETILTEDAN